MPAEATASESVDDELNETVVETVAGTVRTVEINAFLNTAKQLKRAAKSGGQAIFWSGASSTAPTYSWTFRGEDVDLESAYLEFDPTVTVSELGSGTVANLMKQAAGGLVLEFAHEGELPGTATLYVAVDGAFSDGAAVGLYCYDVDARCFVLEEAGIEVVDGYVSFRLTHCSTWALSVDDLSAYSVEEVNTPGAAAAADSVAAEADSSVVLYLAGGVVALAVVAGAVLLAANRRQRLAEVEAGAGAGAVSEAGAGAAAVEESDEA